MKKSITRSFFARMAVLLIAFLLVQSGLFAQALFSVSSKYFLYDYNQTIKLNHGKVTSDFVQQHDLYFKNGSYYIGALLMVDRNVLNENELENLGAKISTRLSKMLSIRIPIEQLEALRFVEGVQYIETGETVSPDLAGSLYDTRADSVQAGLGGLEMPYDGEGVIIAIIDWGFDYTHPMFYDTSLTNFRLTRAWDQNKMSGPHPDGYDFGTEYVGFDALQAAEQDTLYVFGPGSHGTHVAGIAGGGGAGHISPGIAPGSELIFISLRRDAPSLTDAYNYVHEYAASVGKRYVVNMSFGSHLGPHDGSSLKNQGITEFVSQGGVSVGSAGNNGDNTFHLSHDFSQSDDTLITVVNFQTGIADMFGTTLSMWGSQGTGFAAKIVCANNVNATLAESIFYNSNDEPSTEDTLWVSATNYLIVRVHATASTFFNGKPNIRMELRRVGNFKVALFLASPNSEVHIWSNVRLNSRYTNWGVFLGSNYPGATAGNRDYGLGEPGGVGKDVITVASHIPDVLNLDSLVVSGNLSGFSSVGPTVDGRTKPDISGPGQNILSSVNYFDPGNASITNVVEFNGRNYPFDRYSGTSMSGPAVAGVVALMLQANDYLTASQIKEIIKETARLDIRTGEIDENGTLDWGWGKINALAAVKVAEEMPNYTSISIAPDNVKLYPNPTHSFINIEGINLCAYKIYDMQGRLVQEAKNHTASQIDVHQLQTGTYLLQLVTSANEAVFHKFIRQ
jgi:minor extracellular serine protease Vpr